MGRVIRNLESALANLWLCQERYQALLFLDHPNTLRLWSAHFPAHKYADSADCPFAGRRNSEFYRHQLYRHFPVLSPIRSWLLVAATLPVTLHKILGARFDECEPIQVPILYDIAPEIDSDPRYPVNPHSGLIFQHEGTWHCLDRGLNGYTSMMKTYHFPPRSIRL